MAETLIRFSDSERRFMRRAIELARLGVGTTRPNPVVGAVLVQSGEIVGEGWHERAGGDHAEVMAIRAAGERAAGSTLYVTLEPCNHYGRTPPCTRAIVDAGIERVVVAVLDPALHNEISGADMLSERGVTVSCGLCAEQAAFDNRYFLGSIQSGRPWTIAKFAASLDGRIATASGQSKWITSAASRLEAHAIRAEVDAILVGSGTVLADDPELTARIPGSGVRQPIRIVLDARGRISPKARILSGSADSPVLIATTAEAPEAWMTAIRETPAEPDIVVLEAGESGGVSLPGLMLNLTDREVRSLMVEGGSQVMGSFLDAGFIDETCAFIAPTLIGGVMAPGPIGGIGCDSLDNAFRLVNVTVRELEGDILVRGLTRQLTTETTNSKRRLCLQES